MYRHTGEVAVIRELWPVMNLYMSYMESRAVDDIADFGLGDWCASVEDVCPTAVTDTAYYYVDCVTMGKMADLIGEDSDKWNQQASRVKAAWRREFWEKERYTGYQTFYACAIYQGLLEKDEIAGAAAKLAELLRKSNYRLEGGTLAIKYMFAALSENGYADILYKMVTNPEYPSYAYWINKGMTTLCESWNMDSSLNHHMYSEVDNWFYRYVGGIRFSDEGLVIAPVYLEDVEEIKVRHRGIEVQRTGRKVTVKLDVPASIPAVSNGTVQPGEYHFEL
jgi:alpha-L-rhamnosidase